MNKSAEHSFASDFPVFLNKLKLKMHAVFSEYSHAEYLTFNRGIPSGVLSEIMPLNPLSVLIPLEYGGRGGRVDESLLVISAAAYESLAFSLTLGINSALFLHPVIKYAQEEVKQKIFNGFLQDKKMGGLMITEPDFGSDALSMQTSFTKTDDHFYVKGTKHWAGLTGAANYWLLTAREQDKKGHLKRDIDFFICDVAAPNQQIVVDELYSNLGLHQIPYGRNIIDVKIPEIQRLQPQTTGINMMLDTLHRSRLQFPAMGLGFIQRMLDEAIEHSKIRIVGGKNLLHYDQVQSRIAKIQAYFTICSAMCAYSCKNAGIENNLTACGMEANSFKALSSDMMQQSAQSLVQLVGAMAYRYNHIAGRGIIDSRPFQIFEGSNDILYAQIAENIIKRMKQENERNLYRFLKNENLTKQAALEIKDLLNFELNVQIPQRKLVEFGQIISRVVATEMVIRLNDIGFRQDLIANAQSVLKTEIASLAGQFMQKNDAVVIEEYQQNCSWVSN